MTLASGPLSTLLQYEKHEISPQRYEHKIPNCLKLIELVELVASEYEIRVTDTAILFLFITFQG